MVDHSGAARAEDDELATVALLRALTPDFAALFAVPTDAATTIRIERARSHHRPPAGQAGMDRDARAPARPPFGTSKTRPKPLLERDTAQQGQLLRSIR
jgi:hypothetical protein